MTDYPKTAFFSGPLQLFVAANATREDILAHYKVIQACLKAMIAIAPREGATDPPHIPNMPEER